MPLLRAEALIPRRRRVEVGVAAPSVEVAHGGCFLKRFLGWRGGLLVKACRKSVAPEISVEKGEGLPSNLQRLQTDRQTDRQTDSETCPYMYTVNGFAHRRQDKKKKRAV